jgi:hypothetical protein
VMRSEQQQRDELARRVLVERVGADAATGAPVAPVAPVASQAPPGQAPRPPMA